MSEFAERINRQIFGYTDVLSLDPRMTNPTHTEVMTFGCFSKVDRASELSCFAVTSQVYKSQDSAGG